jgi:hypothetical protein
MVIIPLSTICVFFFAIIFYEAHSSRGRLARLSIRISIFSRRLCLRVLHAFGGGGGGGGVKNGIRLSRVLSTFNGRKANTTTQRTGKKSLILCFLFCTRKKTNTNNPRNQHQQTPTRTPNTKHHHKKKTRRRHTFYNKHPRHHDNTTSLLHLLHCDSLLRVIFFFWRDDCLKNYASCK